jgi:hypothetical protein
MKVVINLVHYWQRDMSRRSRERNQRQPMRWIEIIELQSAGNHRQKLESVVEALIAEVEKEAGRGTIRAYSRESMGTDYSVHLVHDVSHVEEGGSSLGLHLAATLREFGLVHHTVWVLMKGGHGGVALRGKEHAR